jgi:hypothetical protein
VWQERLGAILEDDWKQKRAVTHAAGHGFEKIKPVFR